MESTPVKPASLAIPQASVFEAFHSLLRKRIDAVTEMESRNKLWTLYGPSPGRFSNVLASGQLPLCALFGRRSNPEEKSTRSESSDPADPLTPELKTHPAYRWFDRSADFTTAFAVFHRYRTKASEPDRDTLEQLKLLNDVVASMVFCIHTAASGWQPQLVSASGKRTAAEHASQLLQDLEGGVRLKDAKSTDLLKQLLTRLHEELSFPDKRDYAGHFRERTALTMLAKGMLLRGGLKRSAVVEIVHACSQLYGFGIKPRSVQRYVKDAEAELEQERRAQILDEVAKALTR